MNRSGRSVPLPVDAVTQPSTDPLPGDPDPAEVAGTSVAAPLIAVEATDSALGSPLVVIAMLTFRRPEVRDAIEAVLLQIDAGRHGRTSLLVVDNDPMAGAAPVVTGWADPRVRYVHEPRPGIAAARNRALDESTAADLLIFIDDDERPADHWLDRLLAAQRTYGGAGVVGAVVSTFEHQPEEWITAGGFFDRRRLPTGSPVAVAATNNLLLDLATVNRVGLRFDERFSSSGGSDTLFTRELVARGGPLIWCDEAVVVDVVPAARRTRSWVLRRAFRSGNSWSRTSLALARSPAAQATARIELLGRGVLRTAGGTAKLLLGWVTRSLRLRARGLRTAARGAGMIAGAVGLRYHEYRYHEYQAPTPSGSTG